METKEFLLYHHNIAIALSGKYTSLPSRCLHDESGKSDLPETPVKSSSIDHAKTYFDTQYLQTLSGLLKITERVCTFSAFAASLCGSQQYSWYMGDVYSALWTSIATAIAFLATLALLIAHLFHLVDTFHAVPWNTIEMVCSIVEVHCMLFSGAIMMAFADALTNRRICALFCWAAAIAYGRDAFLFLTDTRHTPDIIMESSIQPKDLGETKVENARVISSKCELPGS